MILSVKDRKYTSLDTYTCNTSLYLSICLLPCRFRYQSDNSPVTFTNWHKNEPDNLGVLKTAANVIVSVFTGDWKDASAFEIPSQFVCERVQGPNYSWQTLAGLELYFVAKRMPLSMATLLCQDMGGRLFEPRSIRQTHEVRMKSRQFGLADFWVGVSDSAIDGK